MSASAPVARLLERIAQGDDVAAACSAEGLACQRDVRVDAHYDGKPVCTVTLPWVVEGHAILMADEAHATGVFGERGSGLVEEAGCADGVQIRVGTLSKALGAGGGFVAGHGRLIEWLRHKARAWVFSTAHPPAVAGAAARAIELLGLEPERRRELRARAHDFRQRLAARGIVPLIAGEPAAAVALSARLAEAGFFVPAIRPPSVPAGRSLVRASLSWLHTEADLVRLADAI